MVWSTVWRMVWPKVWTMVWPKVCSVWPLVWTTVWPMVQTTVWPKVCSVCPMVWTMSGQSGQWCPKSVQSVQWCPKSVRSAQWSGQCLVSLANGVQSLLGLANTYLWVLSVWPMPVLGMVGLANTCLGSRTSSWVVMPSRQCYLNFSVFFAAVLLKFEIQMHAKNLEVLKKNWNMWRNDKFDYRH